MRLYAGPGVQEEADNEESGHNFVWCWQSVFLTFLAREHISATSTEASSARITKSLSVLVTERYLIGSENATELK